MNLSQAVEALKNGKKVRLKGWDKKSHIKMVGDVVPEIKYYFEATSYFPYDPKILLTDEWYALDDYDKEYNFPEMVNQLRLGKSCRREDWPEDKYIVYDKQSGIVIKRMEEGIGFSINFDSLILEEWELLGENKDDGKELPKDS